MARGRIVGPVRRSIVEAAQTAEMAAAQTADVAQQNIFKVTSKCLTVLDKCMEVLENIEDGKIKIKAFGKVLPFEILWDTKDDDQKRKEDV